MKENTMSMAKRYSDIEIGQVVRYWEAFDIEADPFFYHVTGEDSEMHDIEAVEDTSIRLKVLFQRCK